MTRGSLCTSAGVPSEILRPNSMATTRSEMPITMPMWCSTSSTVRPYSSRTRRMVAPNSSTSWWVSPAAGSSSRSRRGWAARARASSSRLSVPNGSPAAGRNASSCRSSERRIWNASAASAAFLASGADSGHRTHEAHLAEVVRSRHRVLEQAHRREQRQVLERPRDAESRDAVGADGQQVFAVESQATTCGVVDATHDVEHRGLAGTVRTDQSEDLAFGDLERQTVERHDSTEHDRDLIGFE